MFKYLILSDAALGYIVKDEDVLTTSDSAEAYELASEMQADAVHILEVKDSGHRKQIVWDSRIVQSHAEPEERARVPGIDKKKYQPWTKEDDLWMINAQKRGMSYQAIAEHLGRNKKSVSNRISRVRAGRVKYK